LIEASRIEGKSLNQYVEEVLSHAVDVHNLGHNLDEIIRFFLVLEAQRASGATFTPLNVYNYLTDKVYAAEKDRLQAEWYESGKWYGLYLKEKFEDPVQALADLLRATRWDINEVNVKKAKKVVKLTCISTALTAKGTELLRRFIEGTMHNLEFETQKSESMKGIIHMEFVPA
jgi:hypothetical protein